MRYLKCLLCGIMVVGVLGCASIPKQSAELSGELAGMIRNARASHLALLDEYLLERRNRIDDFIKNTWIPKFMDVSVKETKIIDELNRANSNEDKIQIMKEFQEGASRYIEERRTSIVDALDVIGNQLRNKIEEHYDQMEIVNETLTAHLRSAERVNATRDEILKAINVPIKDMIPFEKISKGLDKITAFEGKAEEFSNKVEEFKNILK